MFACQNFLKKSCSKFYKEQKLFYGHLIKMTTTFSKLAHNAELGAVLQNFAKSWRHQFVWRFLEALYFFI